MDNCISKPKRSSITIIPNKSNIENIILTYQGSWKALEGLCSTINTPMKQKIKYTNDRMRFVSDAAKNSCGVLLVMISPTMNVKASAITAMTIYTLFQKKHSNKELLQQTKHRTTMKSRVSKKPT